MLALLQISVWGWRTVMLKLSGFYCNSTGASGGEFKERKALYKGYVGSKAYKVVAQGFLTW